MSDPIIVTVPGGHVQYRSWDNKWSAHREGAEVSVRASLNEAKQALVDLVKRESSKENPFKRHTAYLVSYSRDPEIVEVTSYADDHYAWVKHTDGKRSKERFDDLRKVGGDNTALVDEIVRLSKEVSVLQEKRHIHRDRLAPYTKQG